MLEVLCIGNTVYDMFIKPHELEQVNSCKKKNHRNICEELLCFGHGEKISIDEVDYSLGGSACNVAVGLKNLGIDSGLASYTGEDYTGDKVNEKLNDAGVNLDHFKTDNSIHSFFSVIVRYKKERTILTYRGKFDANKIHIPKTKKSKWIYISNLTKGYESVYKKVMSLVSEKGVKVAINPGKTQLKEKKKEFLNLLKVTDIMILNKEEAQYLVRARFPLQIRELYYKLAEFGVKNIVITDGKNGAYAYVDKKVIHQEPYQINNLIEKTGSGDAFSSGFLASYIKDEDINKALRWGVINGAMVTREIGAQNGILTYAEMEELDKKWEE